MGMFAKINSFVRSESGVVTVDWVLLSALLVALGMTMTSVVGAGLSSLSAEIKTVLERDQIVQAYE